MKISDVDVDLMIYEKYKPWDEKKVTLDFLPWYLPEKRPNQQTSGDVFTSLLSDCQISKM